MTHEHPERSGSATRRLLRLAAAGVLALPLLAACGDDDEAVVEEPVTAPPVAEQPAVVPPAVPPPAGTAGTTEPAPAGTGSAAGPADAPVEETLRQTDEAIQAVPPATGAPAQ